MSVDAADVSRSLGTTLNLNRQRPRFRHRNDRLLLGHCECAVGLAMLYL